MLKDNVLKEKMVKIRINFDTLDPRKKAISKDRTSLKEQLKSFVETLQYGGKDAYTAWDTDILHAGDEIELPITVAEPLLDEKIEFYPDFKGAESIMKDNSEAIENTRVFKHRAELC